MNTLLFSIGIIAFFVVLLSAVVLIVGSPRERVRRWLALFLFFGASWSLIINLQNPSLGSSYNLFIVNGTFVAAILMVYCMWRFVYQVIERIPPRSLLYAMGIMTGGLLFLIITRNVIPFVELVDDTVIPKRLFTYYLVAAFILLVSFFSVFLLIKAAKSRSGIMRTRLHIVSLGLTSGIVIGLTTNVILPNITGNIAPARYGWISIGLWTVILIYAVVRHRLIDVRLAAVRSAAYFLVLATLAAAYFILAWVVALFLRETSFIDPTQFMINVGFAVILAAILSPLKHFFDRLTNKIFYRDNYNIDDFFARLSRELSLSNDLRDLLQRGVRVIDTTIKAEFTFFYIHYGDDHHMSVGTPRHGRMYQHDIEVLDDFIRVHGQTIIVTDTLDESDPLYRLLRRHEIAMTLPLVQGDKNLGYLFLGGQRSRDYTRRDIRALETISDELVIAIQNAQSVQEVKEINETLQQRIQDATKELRQSNMQLQRLDTAKDEFVSMASHQLRTPLTSVKGYISMVLEGDAGRINAVQRQLLSEAFTSSERMVHLINDFLNVSRLQTGKFMLESKPIDLSKVIKQEVDSLKSTAEAHSLSLDFKSPPYFPTLYLDESKIRQVAMNFIDNAIYYSREGTTITIKLYVDNGDAVLEVHDTGIGVPASEQAHLFTKFFRATNARKQRPDGTGVGLFLAKKVIVAHGGSMVFESAEDEGSTFGFRLPIKRLSAPADDAEKLKK